ncbi:hypothetical protein ACWCOT_40665 [Nonomuraea bangladeshensis]|uniref:hypothetical protein n=1 Tax=Nonomuraea bangladeshensis TaxID=404385 RepID=UPI003C2CB5A7
MIVAAAVCPHPPLLLRELAGRQDVLADLRATCAETVADLLAHAPDRVAVVGGADTTHEPYPLARPDIAAYGTARPRPAPGHRAGMDGPDLPLSLAIGGRLLAGNGWYGPTARRAVAWDASPDVCDRLGRELASLPGRVALLVLADGTARRSVQAPGHLDDRAHALDQHIVTALESGDPGALTALDPDLAHDLMAQGRAALHVLGAAVAGSSPRARLRRLGDPLGVLYAVASWKLSR